MVQLYNKKLVWSIGVAILIIGIGIFGLRILIFRSTNKIEPVTSNDVKSSKVDLLEIISLDQIFASPSSELTSDDLVTIIATGDVVPGRSVNYQTTKFNDFAWPWSNVKDFLSSGDLTYINFEVPLVKNCPVTNEGMVFCGDPSHILGLTSSGIDVANIANNHSGDAGQNGVIDTVKTLTDAGISVTGNGQTIYKTFKGSTFAFLGYNDIGSRYNPSPVDVNTIKSDISIARNQADVVIVGFHWGVEYTNQPNFRQSELAHVAVDAGADLIIGNHPHWIQPVEIYKGNVITYAHGNFIFDQMWSEKTEEGVVGIYTFQKDKLVGLEFKPVKIKDYGQPYFLEGANSLKVLKDLEIQSRLLGGRDGLR